MPPKKDAAVPGVKRGPGRPPTKQQQPVLEKYGIVEAPHNPNSKLEFAHGEPMIFKLLFTYFKNINAHEIHLRCTKTGITFFTRDHQHTSKIFAHISGEHVNWYYCEEEFWIGIDRLSVEKIFSSIDKTLYKISMIYTNDEPDSLLLILKDPEVCRDDNYKISLINFIRDSDLYEVEEVINPVGISDRFPVEFTFSEAQFKKVISNASHFSDTITIEKYDKHNLQITCAKSNLIYKSVFRDDEKIKLRTDIEEGQNFRATIKINNIKSLASSMVTEDVKVLCREHDDMLFQSAINTKALIVSTLIVLGDM